MSARPPLKPRQLCHPCRPAEFGFRTTAELEDLTEIRKSFAKPAKKATAGRKKAT